MSPAIGERPSPARPSPLPLSAFPLAESLGPVVKADDACLAASWWADPTGASKYYRARYYDPKVGRFLSEDPIGSVADISFHAKPAALQRLRELAVAHDAFFLGCQPGM